MRIGANGSSQQVPRVARYNNLVTTPATSDCMPRLARSLTFFASSNFEIGSSASTARSDEQINLIIAFRCYTFSATVGQLSMDAKTSKVRLIEVRIFG